MSLDPDVGHVGQLLVAMPAGWRSGSACPAHAPRLLGPRLSRCYQPQAHAPPTSSNAPYIHVPTWLLVLSWSRSAKATYGDRAKAAGVPAIISAGIYPGTSNVMAAHIISIARGEYDNNWNHKERAPGGCARA